MSDQNVRHTVGLDLGTSGLRIQVAHFDPLGRPVGEPAAVHLPQCERDGVLPTVLHVGARGELRAYGRAAVQQLSHSATETDAGRFVAEFKPCLGQAPEDLAAQGRPEKARHCTNPSCPRVGTAWSPGLQFCGFCGGPLSELAEQWQPQFPYPAEEARAYAGLLLAEVRQHLERRLNEPLRREAGWQIVAGVPVHWQAGTRAGYQQVLAQAFPEAGISLLSEPEGALRYYGCQGLVRSSEGWTLVVDFGAGTTDLVVGRMFARGADQLLGEVRAYGERYGGADFDLLLARHAAAELGVELEAKLLARWKLEAQRWKEAFSDAAQFDAVAETGFSFPVPLGERGCDFRTVVLTRQTFGQVAGELVARFRSVLERGLRHFGVAPNEVTQVVLTGGGAQWYFVEEAVRELLPDAHLVGGVEPVRAIARGLALAPALPQLLEAATLPAEPEPVAPVSPRPEPLPAEPVRPEPLCDPEELPRGGSPNRSETERQEERGPSSRPPHGGEAVVRAALARTLRVAGGKLNTAALSPDGDMVVTGIEGAGLGKSGKGRIGLWGVAVGAEQRSFPGEAAKALAFSADGDRLAALFYTGTGGSRSRVALLDVGSGATLWSQVDAGFPRALAFSTATRRVVTGQHLTSAGDTVIYRDAVTGATVRTLKRDSAWDPIGIALSPDGSAAAFACDRGSGTGASEIRIYTGDGRHLSGWLAMPERGFAWKWAWLLPESPVAFSADGATLAVGSRTRTAAGVSGRVVLIRWRWPGNAPPRRVETFAELEQQGRVRLLDGHGDHVMALAYSPDGSVLASGSDDGSVILWDPETGSQRQVLTAHGASVVSLGFTRSGDRMLSASSDGIVQIWSMAPAS